MNQQKPRPFRFDVGIPIRFFSEDGLISGHCLNISASGILAEFDKPLANWMVGELTVVLDEGHINIGVRVARVDGREAGLAFYIEDDNDRLAVGRLMTFASEHSQPV